MVRNTIEFIYAYVMLIRSTSRVRPRTIGPGCAILGRVCASIVNYLAN